MNIIEYISQPWHWAVSGLAIVFVMFILIWFGGRFGVSSNLRTMCAIGGAGSKIDYFNFDWKSQLWNLVFVFSAILGGYIAITYLHSPDPVQISQSTQEYLSTVGISTPQTLSEGHGYVPSEIYRAGENGLGLKNLLMLVGGGFLIGFGTRYAGGCTSGHAISGLSNLQISSLIAVVGFFIGGLLMTWFILPYLLTL